LRGIQYSTNTLTSKPICMTFRQTNIAAVLLQLTPTPHVDKTEDNRSS